MASSQAIISGDASLSRQQVFLPKETGRLKSLTATAESATPRPGQTWVQIGIMISATDPPNRQVVLAQGYTSITNSIFWTGNIPLEPTMQIFMYIWSSATGNIRLATIVEN